MECGSNGVLECWSVGVLEEWNNGVMERKNKNRGYQRLRVWEDAVALYVETCQRYKSMPFEILDRQAFKLENGLLRLVESLERKRGSGTWVETMIINESNNIYTGDAPDDP